MHDQPAKSWRLDELARAAAVSRTSFAEQFRAVGEVPPLTYLNNWRMLLAQRCLRDDDTRVGALAVTLGYSSRCVLQRIQTRGRYVSTALPGACPR